MEELRIIILTLMLIVSNVITIYLYLNNKKQEKTKDLHDKLFQIQTVSLNYPYLEDKKFIDEWNNFKKKYHSNCKNLKEDEKKEYLRYEQYCEMLFNLISNAHNIDCLYKEIEFKSWARNHKEWWRSPLENHSNRDTYGDKLSDIIDKWIK